jgi:hypothetical protein
LLSILLQEAYFEQDSVRCEKNCVEEDKEEGLQGNGIWYLEE